MKSTLDLAMDALSNFFNQVGAFVPKLVGGLIILIIGYFIARSLRWTIQKGFGLLKVDSLFDRAGLNGLLAKTGMNLTGTKLISDLIYWIIMLVVWVAFFNSIGLEVISNLINQVILFMPNLIVACLIIAVGMYLGDFVEKVATATLNSTGQSANAGTFANIAKMGVIFLTVTIALSQLGIGGNIINTVVQSVFGGLGLAFGIAFGMGGKDWAQGIISKYLGK
jgi:hypothetical protein